MDKSYFTVKAENRQFEEAQAFIREVLRLHFGDTERYTLKKVQIAGTNGKGSTAAMLASILMQAGYSTGLYTSPSLVCVNERIRLNGTQISDEDLCSYIPVIAEAQEKIGRVFGGFERITAASMLYYLDNGTDIAVMETGLGGRYDTVSAVDELILSCITSIGMDHMVMLGNSIDKIAWEKCGIMRENVPTVAHMQKREADDVIVRCASDKSSRLVRTNSVQILHAENTAFGQHMQVICDDEKYDIDINLAGEYQRENAASALLCALELRKMGFDIPKKAIERGFSLAHWEGRLQVVHMPYIRSAVTIDGAHNPHAMRAVADHITAQDDFKKKTALLSVMADKDIDGVLRELSRFCDRAVCVSVTPRSCDPVILAEMCRSHGIQASASDSIDAGLRLADEMAEGGEFFALGSLYLAGEILKRLK